MKGLGATGLLSVDGRTTTTVYSGGIAAGDAQLRIGHFSPDALPVGMYANGDPFPGLQGIPFGVLPDYLTVPAGTYQAEVMPAGNASTVTIDAGVTFRRNRDCTATATDAFDTTTPVVLADTNCPAPYSKVSVRVVYFSPDTPEVGIVVKDGPMLFSGPASDDVLQYETVPARTYDPQVVLSSNEAVVLNLPRTMFPDGRTISAFAVGFVTSESSGFSILPVVDAVPSARKPEPSSGSDVCRVG